MVFEVFQEDEINDIINEFLSHIKPLDNNNNNEFD